MLFFVLSIGRSGTKFLAELLNQDPNALVEQEPPESRSSDRQAYWEAFHSQQKGKEYIQGWRGDRILEKSRKNNTYGQVNSYLRRHCQALKERFPQALFFHLVRDPRDVIRSAMSRRSVTSGLLFQHIYPKEGAFKDRWGKMSLFEKVCWYWQVENRYLRQNIKRTLRLEDIISDYSLCRDRLFAPLGLDIPKDVWQREVSSPKNVTRNYAIPEFLKWSKEWKVKLAEICGEEMARYGYL